MQACDSSLTRASSRVVSQAPRGAVHTAPAPISAAAAGSTTPAAVYVFVAAAAVASTATNDVPETSLHGHDSSSTLCSNVELMSWLALHGCNCMALVDSVRGL